MHAQRRERHAAGPAHERRRDRQIENRRLHANRRVATIHDQIDAPVEILTHVLGRRRTRPREAIRARRGNGDPRAFEQRARDRMRGHAHGHRRQSGGHDARESPAASEESASADQARTRGQRGRESRNVSRHCLELRGRCEMHDHRIGRGPSLRLEDARCRRRVQRMRAEAVHGLRRKCHQPTANENRGCVGDRLSDPGVAGRRSRLCVRVIGSSRLAASAYSPIAESSMRPDPIFDPSSSCTTLR